jgi:hypothetical protein
VSLHAFLNTPKSDLVTGPDRYVSFDPGVAHRFRASETKIACHRNSVPCAIEHFWQFPSVWTLFWVSPACVAEQITLSEVFMLVTFAQTCVRTDIDDELL